MNFEYLYHMKFTHKPNEGHYPIFYKGYIDTLEDIELMATLTTEKDRALAVFHSIPLEKADYRYADGKWSIKQVLIHIIDTEMVFGYRALAIARGEKQELPGFDQDEYMAGTTDQNTSLSELISCFADLRSANIALFKRLREEDLEKEGIASGYPVKVGVLGYFIAGHCRYHLNILSERYGI